MGIKYEDFRLVLPVVAGTVLMFQTLLTLHFSHGVWGHNEVEGEENDIAKVEHRLDNLERRMENEIGEISAALQGLTKMVENNVEQTTYLWKELSRIEKRSRSTRNNQKIPSVIKNTDKKYDVVCYFNGWSSTKDGGNEMQPENIDPTLCSHIVYYRAHLDPDTLSLKPAFPSLNESSVFYKRMIELKKKNPELQILLSVGSWFDSETEIYVRVIENRETRKAFVKDAVKFLKQHNFDGLDIFWVYPLTWLGKSKVSPQAEHQFNFVLLLEELKEAFDLENQRLGLSLSVDAHKSRFYEAFPLRSIATLVDRVHVLLMLPCPLDMTCLHSPLQKYEGQTDPKSSVSETVQFWTSQGIPRRKVIVVVISSGMSYVLKDSNDYSVGIHANVNIRFSSFKKMCDDPDRSKWTFIYHTPSETYYAYDDDRNWESYEVPMSLAAKAQFVKQEKLGGIGIWLISNDDHEGTCCGIKYPLLRTISNVLYKDKDEIDELPCQRLFHNITTVGEHSFSH